MCSLTDYPVELLQYASGAGVERAVRREEQQMEHHHPLAAHPAPRATRPSLRGQGCCWGTAMKRHPPHEHCALATVFLFLNCYKPPHWSESDKGNLQHLQVQIIFLKVRKTAT